MAGTLAGGGGGVLPRIDLAEPDAAMHGAMARSVRGETKHRAHGEQTAAMIFGLERDALEAAPVLDSGSP